MLIAIDGNEANVAQRVGIGQYAFQVLLHLYKHQISNIPSISFGTGRYQKDNVKFIIYLKNKPRRDLPKETSLWKYKVFGPKKLWTQFALPACLFLGKEKPDIFFSPSHYAPRFSFTKQAISIMDLSFIHFPAMFTKRDLLQLRWWTYYSVKKASIIFTISQFSKKDIVDYYQVPEEKVVVTYPGYDKKNFKTNEMKNKHGISGDYILFVGTLQPRKNIEKLVEAFSQIANHGTRITDIKLVIAGKKGWLCEKIFRKVKELELEERVVFTGFVDETDLPDLYRGARCFVLPSLYEGFGIPVVEAMACGCPVVASNASSLPEVVGEAGVLVDPDDAKDIAEGIFKILNLNDDRLKDMIRRGIKQARKFSWEKCAKLTLDMLRKVGGKTDA